MIDAKELLESLTVENVKKLLYRLGVEEIIDLSASKNCLITNTICHNLSGGKMKLYYYIEDKNGETRGTFHCYTSCGDSFNIFELIKRNYFLRGVNLNFTEIISLVCDITGIENHGNSKPDGFGNRENIKPNTELEYLKKFTKKKTLNPEIKVYNEKILGLFNKGYYHQSWLEDNISERAMKRFNILWDFVGHRIIIPHQHWKGKGLIGIKCRELNQSSIEKGFKYVPFQTFGENKTLYSYPTHYNLYGLYENIETIKRKRKIMIVESEKAVLQCESYFPGENFTVALCGSSLGDEQKNILLGLELDTVFLALDKEYESLDDVKFKLYQEKIKKIALQLVPYVNVKVVFDSTGETLNYKDSPTDAGKDVLIELMGNSSIVKLIEE